MHFVVVLGRNYSACHKDNVLSTLLLQFFFQLRDKGEVTGSQAASSYNVDIVVDGLPCNLCWCREERANINVVSKICKATCDNLGPSVMTILPHFCNQNSRISSLFFAKVLNISQCIFVFLLSRNVGIFHGLFGVGSPDDGVRSHMPANYFLNSVGDLANSCS